MQSRMHGRCVGWLVGCTDFWPLLDCCTHMRTLVMHTQRSLPSEKHYTLYTCAWCCLGCIVTLPWMHSNVATGTGATRKFSNINWGYMLQHHDHGAVYCEHKYTQKYIPWSIQNCKLTSQTWCKKVVRTQQQHDRWSSDKSKCHHEGANTWLKYRNGLKKLTATLRKQGAQALRHLPVAISATCNSSKGTNEDQLSPWQDILCNRLQQHISCIHAKWSLM